MSTETNEPAATPAEGTVVENDGIIDLDAVTETEQPSDDDEDKPEAKAEEPKPEGEEEKKKLSGAARAKLREQRLLTELADTNRRLEEATRSQPADKTASDDDKPPREEDFPGDWFAFDRAKTAYEAGKAAREAIRKEFKTKEDSERASEQSKAARARAEAHAERVEDVKDVITDFDDVMAEMKGVNVRDDVIEEIMSSEKSALLAYHLAQNPEKLEALNRMNPRELAREMGRLEATVKMPTAKKQTSAPAPASSVKGGASPSSPEADLSAWLKKTYG